MSSAEVYRDSSGQWRWRLRAGNGRVIADSGEAYRKQADCLAGLRLATDSRPEQVHIEPPPLEHHG